MNLAQLRTATLERAGVSSTDAMLTTAVLNDLVNSAKNYVATVHDWPWQQVLPVTFNTVAGTQNYAVPVDWLRTVDLRILSAGSVQNGLTLYSPMELDDRWPTTITGQPREYAIFGDTLRIAPAPDGVYQVSHRYIRVEPDLVLDADVPIMPAQFHVCLVEYAAFLACRRISEEARGNVARGEFDRWMQIMLQDRRRSTAPQRIRVRPGSLI